MLTSEPFLRAEISPRSGPYSWNKWLITPRPRVVLTRSVSNPINPRIGMRASMVHVGDFRLAPGKIFHHRPHGFLWNFQEQFFNRLQQTPLFVVAIDHFR